MFRKVTLTIAAAVLVAGSVSALPAQAAPKISNGVACSKAGATTKVNGYGYKCAKNTLVKNSKLTWLSVECLSAISKYNLAVKDYATVGAVQAQTAELDAKLATANADLTKTTTALDNAKVQLTSARDVLAKTTDPKQKQDLSNAITKLAGAIITLSTSKQRLALKVQELASERANLANAPTVLKEAVADTKAQATLLCAKGF